MAKEAVEERYGHLLLVGELSKSAMHCRAVGLLSTDRPELLARGSATIKDATTVLHAEMKG